VIVGIGVKDPVLGLFSNSGDLAPFRSCPGDRGDWHRFQDRLLVGGGFLIPTLQGQEFEKFGQHGQNFATGLDRMGHYRV